MSDEAAPQSPETSQQKMQAVDPDGVYLFTGARLEEMLMQVAGAVSGVFMRLDPELVMPTEEVSDAVNQWGILSPEILAGAVERAEMLRDIASGGQEAAAVIPELLERLAGRGEPQGMDDAELTETAVRHLIDLILIDPSEVPDTEDGKAARGEQIIAAARAVLQLNPKTHKGGAAAEELPSESLGMFIEPEEVLSKRLVRVGTEAIERQVGVDPSITAASEALARVVVRAVLTEIEHGGTEVRNQQGDLVHVEPEPAPSTQPQFAVGDAVEVHGHHAHTLPPLLEPNPVFELPIPGKIVGTDPAHPELVQVEVELPTPVGTRRVQLHVDQIEKAAD